MNLHLGLFVLDSSSWLLPGGFFIFATWSRPLHLCLFILSSSWRPRACDLSNLTFTSVSSSWPLHLGHFILASSSWSLYLSLFIVASSAWPLHLALFISASSYSPLHRVLFILASRACRVVHVAFLVGHFALTSSYQPFPGELFILIFSLDPFMLASSYRRLAGEIVIIKFPNRAIVSFRSCVRAGEAKLRGQARDASVVRPRFGPNVSSPTPTRPAVAVGLSHWWSRGCPVVVQWLSRGCPVVVPWLSRGCPVVV